MLTFGNTQPHNSRNSRLPKKIGMLTFGNML